MTSPVPKPRPRGRQSLRDLAISILVLVVPIVVLVAFCSAGGDDAPTIDPAGSYREARVADKIPVVEPGLGDDWRATTASYRTNRDGSVALRVSYLTPDGDYLQILQTDQDVEKLLTGELGTARPGDIERVGKAEWRRYSGRRSDEDALVWTKPGATILVTGDADRSEQRKLLNALS